MKYFYLFLLKVIQVFVTFRAWVQANVIQAKANKDGQRKEN